MYFAGPLKDSGSQNPWDITADCPMDFFIMIMIGLESFVMEKTNYKKAQTVLFVILIANLVVAVLKIAVGTIINSSSMTADGFHSLSDGSSNIVGLIGINLRLLV